MKVVKNNYEDQLIFVCFGSPLVLILSPLRVAFLTLSPSFAVLEVQTNLRVGMLNNSCSACGTSCAAAATWIQPFCIEFRRRKGFTASHHGPLRRIIVPARGLCNAFLCRPAARSPKHGPPSNAWRAGGREHGCTDSRRAGANSLAYALW